MRQVLLSYERLYRPAFRTIHEVSVSYLCDARAIYLQNAAHRSRLVNTEALLGELCSDSDRRIPAESLKEDVPCALRDAKLKGRWVRGLVRTVDEDGVWVQAVDHGWMLPRVPSDELDTIKPLPAQLDAEPLVSRSGSWI